jgi:hypothetical protein
VEIILTHNRDYTFVDFGILLCENPRKRGNVIAAEAKRPSPPRILNATKWILLNIRETMRDSGSGAATA